MIKYLEFWKLVKRHRRFTQLSLYKMTINLTKRHKALLALAKKHPEL